MTDEGRLSSIDAKIAELEKKLSSYTGEQEAYNRKMRDTLMNLDGDNIPSLRFIVTADYITAALTVSINGLEASIHQYLVNNYSTSTQILQYISETEAQIQLVASGAFSGGYPTTVGDKSPTYSTTMSALEAVKWAKLNVLNGQLFYNNTSSTLNSSYEVLKPSGGFLNTKIYKWSGSEWIAFSDVVRTSNIFGVSAVSNLYAYITATHTVGTVTYTAGELYKSVNNNWTLVVTGTAGYISAAAIIAAVNADGSSLKFKADKIEFTASGYVKFSDLDGTSSIINGGAIISDSFTADKFYAKNQSNQKLIDFYAGIDFTAVNVKESSYYRDSRSIIGVRKLRFYEDLSPTSAGFGQSSNSIMQTGQIGCATTNEIALTLPLLGALSGLLISSTYDNLCLTATGALVGYSPSSIFLFSGNPASGYATALLMNSGSVTVLKYNNGALIGNNILLQ